MKVKELIKHLKKMPPDLNIYYSHSDNSDFEIAGDVHYVAHCTKDRLRGYAKLYGNESDLVMFENFPDEWIIIRG